MSYLYSPVPVGDCSQVSTCSDGEQSDTSSGINTASECSGNGSQTDSSTMRPYSEISANLTEPDGVDAWISYLLASRVSRSVSPDSARPKTMSVTCGLKQFASLEKSSPDGAYWRTSQVCLLPSISERYSATWPKAGMIVSGVGYRQPKWEQRIGVIAFGYWRTPHASDGEGGVMEMREGADGHYKLRDHVQPKNKHAWPTPTGTERSGTNPNTGKGEGLSKTAKNWPTASTRDYKDTGDCANVPVNCLLGRAVEPSIAQGSLNPDWVEWLMGWGIGWTSLEPIQELNLLGWETDPADSGTIPRIGTGIPDRVNRLKAIGNGQVPQCVAAAWRLLTGVV